MDPAEIKRYVDVQIAGHMTTVGKQMDLVVSTNERQSKQLEEIRELDEKHWNQMQSNFRLLKVDVDQMTKERIEAQAVDKYKKESASETDKKRDFWLKVLGALVAILAVIVAYAEGHKVSTGELEIPQFFHHKIVDSSIPAVYARTQQPQINADIHPTPP